MTVVFHQSRALKPSLSGLNCLLIVVQASGSAEFFPCISFFVFLLNTLGHRGEFMVYEAELLKIAFK